MSQSGPEKSMRRSIPNHGRPRLMNGCYSSRVTSREPAKGRRCNIGRMQRNPHGNVGRRLSSTLLIVRRRRQSVEREHANPQKTTGLERQSFMNMPEMNREQLNIPGDIRTASCNNEKRRHKVTHPSYSAGRPSYGETVHVLSPKKDHHQCPSDGLLNSRLSTSRSCWSERLKLTRSGTTASTANSLSSRRKGRSKAP